MPQSPAAQGTPSPPRSIHGQFTLLPDPAHSPPPRRTCAMRPLPPTTGMMSVTVLLMRPLMFWLMLLWLTGGCARTLPPRASRSRPSASMMRVARSCGQASAAAQW